MTKEVDLTKLEAAVAEGARVLDVREPDEYESGHVPGARLVPLASLPTQLEEIRHQGPVYVICASGGRSATAADWLSARGVDAYSVAGGTQAWSSAGRPVVAGPHENVA